MKRYGLCLLFVTLCLLCSGPVIAQSLSGLFAAGLGSYSGGVAPLPLDFNTRFYVGWLDSRDGQHATTETDGVPPTKVGLGHYWEIPARGLWLGLVSDCGITSNLSLKLEGWLLAPNVRELFEEVTYRPATEQFIQTPDYSEWFVGGAGLVNLMDGFSAIFGCRYGKRQISYDDRLRVGNQRKKPGRGDFDIDYVSPYLGFQSGYNGDAGNLAISVICGPLVSSTFLITTPQRLTPPARIRRGEGYFNEGYLVEVFGEYQANLADDMSCGVFAKGNWMNAKGDLRYTVHRPGDVGHGNTHMYDFNYYRTGYTLGASLSVRFNVASLLP